MARRRSTQLPRSGGRAEGEASIETRAPPPRGASRRAELEAQIAESWDREAYLVLADHLMQEDDRHGMLIRAQLAAAEEPPDKRRNKNAVIRLLRELVVTSEWTEDIVRDWEWRGGYIARVGVKSAADLERLGALPEPFARLLRAVRFETDFADWAATLAVLEPYEFLDTVELTLRSVEDLAPLERLARLRQLEVSYTRVDPVIASLAHLRELGARRTAIADYGGLARFAALAVLDLGETALADLSPVARLPLVRLVADNTQIVHVDPLRGHPTLRHLDLYGTPIERLDVIPELPALAHLDIRCTTIADLRPLARSATLRELQMLRCTHVRDLAPLLECPALDKLGLSQTHFEDLSALRGLRVRELDVSSSRIKNLDVLRTMPRLERVWAGATLVPPDHLKALRRELPHVEWM